jgi:maltooligosyltrehalose trehalohydrolase
MPGSDTFPWERPLGAFPAGGRTTFRVWAPRAQSLALRLRGEDLQLEDAGHGVFEIEAEAGHDENYFYVVDGEELPDPCSRWQPEGLRGPSRILDTGTFEWGTWGGADLDNLVLYELHVGTFTRDGTFVGAIEKLARLAELGINAIELMPVA